MKKHGFVVRVETFGILFQFVKIRHKKLFDELKQNAKVLTTNSISMFFHFGRESLI